jgi:hypothetical protein
LRAHDVDREARRLADELSALLNGTITDGIRLTAVTTQTRGRAVVGYGITPRQQDPVEGLPLTTTRARARIFLGLSFRLAADTYGQYLMVESSFVGLFADQGLEHALLHYDYERDKADGYPEAHLQVDATSEHWERALPPGRSLSKLHLPTGGRRYRPTLEDLIDCVITERLATGRPGWESLVNRGREDFQRRQMRAAIRNDPEEAISVLTELGHLPRDDDKPPGREKRKPR